MASIARRESNAWIRRQALTITGRVLSVGSGKDSDGEGGFYRSYFSSAAEYLTSDFTPEMGCDLVLDARHMPQIESSCFDGIFCSGVLEHIDDWPAAMREISRVTKPEGVLLLGLPFRQAIHRNMSSHDFWRFSEDGIKFLLPRFGFALEELAAIDESVPGFPATYWARAKRTTPALGQPLSF